MQPTELLQMVGERLDRVGCAWFVTGSVASTVFNLCSVWTVTYGMRVPSRRWRRRC
jgi:hypothetical protein